MTEDLSADSLLGGRLRFFQPRQGYRAAIDPVLLAAAVPARPGERVLDAGAGTGAASLCLAARVPSCRIVGLEIQRTLHKIASRNVSENGLAPQIDIISGDLANPPPRLASASFDHVMTNPPHLASGRATPPRSAERAQAQVEGGLDLAGWLLACLRMLKPCGQLTIIHRTDRLDEILAVLTGRLGEMVIFPFWPDPKMKPAKRVIVQGRKGSNAPLQLARGLMLHEVDGRFTRAAERVLREAADLPLVLPDVRGAHA